MSSISQPFHNIPRDVFLEIFEHSLPLQHNFKQRHTTLTLLRTVCSHWNTIITSNRLFWSSIQIQFPTQVISHTLINLWLERSGDASLDISIIDKPPSSWTQVEMETRHNLMLALAPHIYRFRNLRIDISVGLLPGFQKFRILDAQRLEYFQVNMRGTTQDHVHTTTIQQLTSLVSLSTLSWSSHSPFVLKWLLQFSTPTWLGKLTNIEIRCTVTEEEMLNLFTNCKSSTRITITSVRADAIFPSQSQRTTLQNLHYLDISLPSTSYHTLLQQISLPNLLTLKICGVNMSDLSNTIPSHFPSLKILQAKIWTPKDIINEISTFIRHPNILRLQILGIESQECEGWTEYEGWNELDERPLRQAVDEFNESKTGLRTIKCDIFSDWRRGYFIGWAECASG